MNPRAVRFSEVNKSFGARRVLKDLSFEVGRGEFAVLLGPNGAGKSTSIALATGLLRADAGLVEIFGHRAGSLLAKSVCAYVPQEPAFPGQVRAADLLKFAAAHARTPANTAKVATEFGVDGFATVPARHLSGGQKRALSLACAWVMNPELIILDEPTAGLDLEVRRRVWRLITAYHEGGGSLLMTTHYLTEAEELAERILVLADGRLKESGAPADIKRKFGYKRIQFSALAEPPVALGAVRNGERWQIESREPDEVLAALLAWRGARDIDVAPLALEDVFLKLVGREQA